MGASGPLTRFSGCVWGVDVSTRRVAFAAVREGAAPDFTVAQFPACWQPAGAWDPGRVDMMAQLVVAVSAKFAKRTGTPDVVVVETPTGRHPKPRLWFAAGATLVGLMEFAPFVSTIPVATWKKHSVGRGNATKPEILAWAQAHGLPNRDQDLADALGVAVGGRALITETNTKETA